MSKSKESARSFVERISGAQQNSKEGTPITVAELKMVTDKIVPLLDENIKFNKKISPEGKESAINAQARFFHASLVNTTYQEYTRQPMRMEQSVSQLPTTQEELGYRLDRAVQMVEKQNEYLISEHKKAQEAQKFRNKIPISQKHGKVSDRCDLFDEEPVREVASELKAFIKTFKSSQKDEVSRMSQ